MPKEDKWDYTQSISRLPSKVKHYFLDEARTMFHALSTGTVEIIEDKNARKRPGRYGERYFRAVSTNPAWYHKLYFSYKSGRRLTKKQRAELEKLRIRQAMLQSEK
ncbi:MAG: hypothetical protein AABY16_04565 [Nanoarchaeota archaeon]